MQNENYRNLNGLTQSSVKDFKILSPIEWKKIWIDKTKERKETDSLKFGSLVDTLLFCPERVDDLFITCEVKKPSDSITYIVERVFNVASEKEIDDITAFSLKEMEEHIIEYAKYVPMPDGKIGWGQGKGWSDERVFNTVVKDGEEYFNFLKTTNGKCVVSAGDYMEALLVKDTIINNPISSKYLTAENNIFQLEIHDEDNKLKGALDIVHLNHDDEEIQVVDFKTSESAFYFVSNIWKFGYLDQQAFYDRLLRTWKQRNENSKYKNYSVLPPINLVIDKSYKMPYIYEYNWQDIKNAWSGYIKNERKIKGIQDIIDDINWHIDNDKWDYPREHYETGKISLNLITTDD